MSKTTLMTVRPCVTGVLTAMAIALTAGASWAAASGAGVPESPHAVQLAAVNTAMSAGPFAPAAVDYDSLALDELDKIVNGVDGVTSGFDPTMRQQSSDEDVAANWAAYQEQFGDYQSHGSPEDLTRGEITVVNVPLEMARAPGQFRIAFHTDGQIAGLYLLRTGVPNP